MTNVTTKKRTQEDDPYLGLIGTVIVKAVKRRARIRRARRERLNRFIEIGEDIQARILDIVTSPKSQTIRIRRLEQDIKLLDAQIVALKSEKQDRVIAIAPTTKAVSKPASAPEVTLPEFMIEGIPLSNGHAPLL